MQKKLTNSDLPRLKREISLISLLADRGLHLQKHGRDLVTNCPFHNDKTPSFVVTPDKNLWRCFGACDAGGSNIDFVMKYDSVSFVDAVVILTKTNNVNSNGNKFKDKDKENMNKTENNDFDILAPEVQKVLRMVIDFYRQNLKENREPVDYLLRRHIRQGELIEEFEIGYCDGQLLKKVSDENVISVLKTVGLVKGSSEHFRGCVVFPVFNENNFITQIYGRHIGHPARAGQGTSVRHGRSIDTSNDVKHIYLPGPLQGLFNQRSLIAKDIFLCESIIDALSLMTLGYKNVTCSFGVNGFTNEMADLFTEKQIERVTFCFDSDSAGKAGALKITERLQESGIISRRINLPVKDMNTFIRKVENPSEEFTRLLEEAEILWQPEEQQSVLSVAEAESEQATEKENWQKVDEEYHFTFGNRIYVVRGAEENKSNTALKVFIRLNQNGKFHIDNNLDLFNAKVLGYFIRGAGTYLGLDERVIKDDTDKITATLDEIVKKKLAAKKENKITTEYKINLRMQQRAYDLSKSAHLLSEFLRAVEKCGVIGENINALVCFLATLSRKLPNPLHVMIQSESSAGKSTLLNLITGFVQPEDLLYFTQLTPQSLYYIEPGALQRKTLAIAELDGLSNILYPIKQLMSENKLSNLSTGTDPKTGEHRSNLYVNEGPADVLFTSPKEGVDEEVQNRCVILTLNESIEQTKRIQKMQRLKHSYEGIKMIQEKEQLTELFQHLQREIKSMPVFNQYAPYLDFTAENHQTRRHNEKYLILMDCITLLFQNQRELIERNGVKMIKTHLIDVALANFIAKRIFTKSLDELPPQTRHFLNQIKDFILTESKKENIDPVNCWIYRRQMREITGLSNNRVHEHAHRLENYDYLSCRKDHGGFAYRMIYFEKNGHARSALSLVEIKILLKKAGQAEREEYKNFSPYLSEIFESLDPSFNADQGEVA